MQREMKIEGREIERQRYAKEKIERSEFEAEIKMSLLAHFNWSRCLKNFSVKYLNSTTDETSQLCRQCNCEKLFLIYFWWWRQKNWFWRKILVTFCIEKSCVQFAINLFLSILLFMLLLTHSRKYSHLKFGFQDILFQIHLKVFVSCNVLCLFIIKEDRRNVSIKCS
jgi:hypothetical protein